MPPEFTRGIHRWEPHAGLHLWDRPFLSPRARRPERQISCKGTIRMKKTKKNQEPAQENRAAQHRVRLPGFLLEEEIGLGDVIKKVTYAMGVSPCSGCERRAAALNHWVRFTR